MATNAGWRCRFRCVPQCGITRPAWFAFGAFGRSVTSPSLVVLNATAIVVIELIDWLAPLEENVFMRAPKWWR